MARTASAAGAARIDAVDDAGRRPYRDAGRHRRPHGVPRPGASRPAQRVRRRLRQPGSAVAPAATSSNSAQSGVRISSAADWFMSRWGGQTIGVTGTKGKVDHRVVHRSPAAARWASRPWWRATSAPRCPTCRPTPASWWSPSCPASRRRCSPHRPRWRSSPTSTRTTSTGTASTDSYYAAKANVFRLGSRSLVCTPEVVTILAGIGVTDLPPSLRLVDPATSRRPRVAHGGVGDELRAQRRQRRTGGGRGRGDDGPRRSPRREFDAAAGDLRRPTAPAPDGPHHRVRSAGSTTRWRPPERAWSPHCAPCGPRPTSR